MIGSTLSHFTILRQIGAGGMGVVYAARDERLGRDVAIKVLPAGALADEDARKQFRREAFTLSKINHPNIETVYEFDSQHGVDFLVMELVPGRTLSEVIGTAPLPERDIASLGTQLAEGLAAAHAERILHCDIKPGNIRVTPQGRLKILDFGLARLVRPAGVPGSTAQTMTATQQAVAGTVPYMAPEQLRGERLDGRTDIHAAGTVLYEMATGRRAFPQESQAMAISAILNEPPPSPRRLTAAVSPGLERIVLRCLEKDPRERYATAADLSADLARLGAGSQGVGSRRGARDATHHRRRVVGIAAGVAAVLLLLAAGLNVFGWRDKLLGGHGQAEAGPSLAVLPLANLTGDPKQEFFADGMTDELITRLAQVSGLRVISRSSVMQLKGTKKRLPEIAHDLGVRMIVEGSVFRAGDMVRITAKLIEAASEQALWADGYERPVTNVLALQSEVAQAIVSRVEVKVTPEERGRLRSAPAVDPEAHEAYLRGLVAYHRFTSDGFRESIGQLQKAVETDPNYAPAYTALASAYALASGMYLSPKEAMPRARAAAVRALELDPSSGAAHAVLGLVRFGYEWDAPGAQSEFQEALRLGSGDATVHQYYGVTLVGMGRTDEAIEQLKQAREIDPLSGVLASMSLWPLFEGRRYREAAQEAQRILDSGTDVPDSRMVLGQALFFAGKRREGIEQIRRAVASDPGSPLQLGWLGYLYGINGQREQSREVLRQIQALQQRGQYVQPYVMAIAHIGLGEKDESFRLLDQAVSERSDELFFVRVDPALDPLRDDPRFAAMLQRMGIKS
jgi:TolB-like protein/Tfp pilus assembly protein PilF